MNAPEKKAKSAAKKKIISSCDDCLHFEQDPETGEDICTADLDGDELYRLRESHRASCPFYVPYNEYKSVQKQN